MTMEMLTIDHLYNIFMFIVWIGIIAAFFLSICLRLWIKSSYHIKKQRNELPWLNHENSAMELGTLNK